MKILIAILFILTSFSSILSQSFKISAIEELKNKSEKKYNEKINKINNYLNYYPSSFSS